MDNEFLIKQIENIIDIHLKNSYNKIINQHGGQLPPIDKSENASLKKYGYKLSKTTLSRKRALKRAARSTGTLRVLKRINLIANYSKSHKDNYDKLRADVDFLKNVYAKEKLQKIKNKSSK